MGEIRRMQELMGFDLEGRSVLKEFYEINNENPLKPITEETLSRVINKHGNNGFIIVSANRSDKDGKENNINTRALIADIKAAGFSYLPVYGGYHGQDGVIDAYEPSFIVFCYDRKGTPVEFAVLAEFAKTCCGKYNQDSVLVKAPQAAPVYIDKNGGIVGKATDDEVDLNNPANEFYTSLIKTNNLDYKHPERLKRFSYHMAFECFVNPNPNTLNEFRRRKEGNGEVILEYGNFVLI